MMLAGGLVVGTVGLHKEEQFQADSGEHYVQYYILHEFISELAGSAGSGQPAAEGAVRAIQLHSGVWMECGLWSHHN